MHTDTLILRAHEGDPEAQFMLAHAHLNGDGVESDPNELLRWATAAANQGHARAMYLLAAQHAKGGCLPTDEAKSDAWLKKACDLGLPEAQVSMARGPVGRLADTNLRNSETLRLLHLAADQGYATAEGLLGQCHHKGQIGLTQDSQTAMSWYAKAARRGDADSQYELGLGYYLGDGLTKNHTMAAWWWHKASLQGHAPAMCNLANLYSEGSGVVQNEAFAARMWHLAAQRGDGIAQHNLSIAYRQGKGVEQDEDARMHWLKAAAESGRTEAQMELALLLYNNPGMPDEGKSTFHWLRQAAEAGHQKAATMLSLAYSTERPDAPGIAESYAWGIMAATIAANEEGLEKGKALATLPSLLHAQMTPEQLEEAGDLLREIERRIHARRSLG